MEMGRCKWTCTGVYTIDTTSTADFDTQMQATPQDQSYTSEATTSYYQVHTTFV